MKVRVIVTPRSAILDPQGKAVENSLHHLGYTEAEGVRVGKYIEFSMRDSDRKAAAVKVEEMCKRLLSNPLIEDVRYEFAD